VKYLSTVAGQMMFCPKTKLALPNLVLHSKSSQQMALECSVKKCILLGKTNWRKPRLT